MRRKEKNVKGSRRENAKDGDLAVFEDDDGNVVRVMGEQRGKKRWDWMTMLKWRGWVLCWLYACREL